MTSGSERCDSGGGLTINKFVFLMAVKNGGTMIIMKKIDGWIYYLMFEKNYLLLYSCLPCSNNKLIQKPARRWKIKVQVYFDLIICFGFCVPV